MSKHIFWPLNTACTALFTGVKAPEEFKKACGSACIYVCVCVQWIWYEIWERDRERVFLCYMSHCITLSLVSLQLRWWVLVVCQVSWITYASTEWSHEWAGTSPAETGRPARMTAGWILLLYVFTTTKVSRGNLSVVPSYLPPSICSSILYFSHQVSWGVGEAWETMTSLFLWHKDPLWDPFTGPFYRTRVGTALDSIANMWKCHPGIQSGNGCCNSI